MASNPSRLWIRVEWPSCASAPQLARRLRHASPKPILSVRCQPLIDTLEVRFLPSTASVVLGCSASPAVLGQTESFSVSVTPSTTGDPMPTGTVAFFDGLTLLGTETLSSSGNASIETSLPLGSHTISPVFSGDSTFDPNSDSLSEQINPAITKSPCAIQLHRFLGVGFSGEGNKNGKSDAKPEGQRSPKEEFPCLALFRCRGGPSRRRCVVAFVPVGTSAGGGPLGHELLVLTMAKKTGIRIHPATMSRALAKIEARRGKPRPRIRCPWHPAKKARRLNELRRLANTLPRTEALLYEDEVDVHLNPKIGLDWMGKGQQKDVMTPGQNEKRYLAGALDVRTKQIHWVEGDQKTSWLFMDLLKKLTIVYAQMRIIHVILDNYGIHSSHVIGIALCHFAKRTQLHFLPPYCPDDNRIERVWQDLHANVTRNHERHTMTELMAELMADVRYYLRKRNRRAERELSNLTAA